MTWYLGRQMQSQLRDHIN